MSVTSAGDNGGGSKRGMRASWQPNVQAGASGGGRSMASQTLVATGATWVTETSGPSTVNASKAFCRRRAFFLRLRISCFKAWMELFRYLRKSTMSFTEALFVPRRARTSSTNFWKLKSLSFFTSSSSSSSSSFPKMNSMLSTRPKGSTPLPCNDLHASLSWSNLVKSSLEMVASLSTRSTPTAFFQAFSKCALMTCTAMVSFSLAATALTTSHNTPMSMFMTVSADSKMKV
mmetsp:Transcript_68205/g.197569  ORF Transcript_68205/g.197569 Transcript_68205/m.197569 type:complete len:232 (-) Transcript_68205:1528-2223(-)